MEEALTTPLYLVSVYSFHSLFYLREKVFTSTVVKLGKLPIAPHRAESGIQVMGPNSSLVLGIPDRLIF